MTQDMKTDSWDGITLKEALEQAIDAGTVDDIALLFRLMSPEKRDYYREVFKEKLAQKKVRP